MNTREKILTEEDKIRLAKVGQHLGSNKLDPIGLFMNDLKNTQEDDLLTREEEVSLAKRMEEGDEGAYDELVERNLRLVVSRVVTRTRGTQQMLELIQEGTEGLMQGLRKYDYRKGNRVSSYVSLWIDAKLQRYFHEKHKSLRLPVYVEEELNSMRLVNERYLYEEDRMATNKEIGKELNRGEGYVEELKGYSEQAVSLDAPMTEEGSSTLKDILVGDDRYTPEFSCELSALGEHLDEMTDYLTELEKGVIKYHYGLGGIKKVYTLEEVSEIYGVAFQTIQRRHSTALRKLRHPKIKKELQKWF